MDRISHVNTATPTTKIVQVLSEMGEFEGIKNLIKKDFDGIMLLLEQGIPPSIIDDILVGNSDAPEKVIAAIANVRKNIDTLILKNREKHVLLKEVELKLLQLITVKRVSESSMLQASRYLNIFCDVYAPRRMKEWEKAEDEGSDIYLEEQCEKIYDIPDDQPVKEVTEKEKRMLECCLIVIKSYLDSLKILMYHSDVSPALRKQGVIDEKSRLLLAQNICDTVRKIIDRSVSFQPYHDLCYPKNPFNGARDIIVQWEQISKEIRELQK